MIASADIVSDIAQSLYNQNENKKIFLPAWSMTNDLIKKGSPCVEGYYGVNFVDYDSKSRNYIQFKTKYLNKYGDEPTFSSILSYEAVIVLSEAMKDAKSLDCNNLKNSINKIKEFQGLQSKLILNEFGDIDRDIYLYQIKNKEFIRADE